MAITHLNPASLHANPAFSQGTVIPAGSSIVIVGGQNGIGADGEVVGDSVGAQTEQAFRNLITVLAEARCGARRRREADDHPRRRRRRERGVRRLPEGVGQSADAVTVQFVRGLARPDCLVEVDAIAAVPS